MGSYNYNSSSPVPKPSNLTNEAKSQSAKFGRVIKVVFDNSDPEYFINGRDLSVGGIVFNFLGRQEQVFAYQYYSDLNTYPVPGEIVEISYGPSENLSISSNSSKLYYKSIANIWNQPNNNILPDIYKSSPDAQNEHYDEESFPNDDYFELNSVKGLKPLPGDTLLQGRGGQSIRFNSFYSPFNTSDQPFPITIIRNTSTFDENGSENVNFDDSSIYLTSNHKIPVNIANKKRDSYLNPPISPESYSGKQIILNSDRVIINSKRDNTLISGENSVGINGKQVNIDGDSVISLDAKTINLGGNSLILPENLREPAVLGRQNKKLMEEFIFLVQETANTLRNLSVEPIQAVSELKVLGSVMQVELNLLRELLEKINSTKVFIDSGR